MSTTTEDARRKKCLETIVECGKALVSSDVYAEIQRIFEQVPAGEQGRLHGIEIRESPYLPPGTIVPWPGHLDLFASLPEVP